MRRNGCAAWVSFQALPSRPRAEPRPGLLKQWRDAKAQKSLRPPVRRARRQRKHGRSRSARPAIPWGFSSRGWQCVLRGGPYTTASQVRQCQEVCPPPPWPRHQVPSAWGGAVRVLMGGDCSSRGPRHLGCGGHPSLGAVAQEQVGARERGRDCSGAVLRLPQPEASDDSHGRTRPTARPLTEMGHDDE